MNPILAYRRSLCVALGGLDCPEERDMVARLIAKCSRKLDSMV
jgi:hypothetical protein